MDGGSPNPAEPSGGAESSRELTALREERDKLAEEVRRLNAELAKVRAELDEKAKGVIHAQSTRDGLDQGTQAAARFAFQMEEQRLRTDQAVERAKVLEGQLSATRAELADAVTRGRDLAVKTSSLEEQLARRTAELAEQTRSNQQLRRSNREAPAVPTPTSPAPRPMSPSVVPPPAAIPARTATRPPTVISPPVTGGSNDAASRAANCVVLGIRALTTQQYSRARELFAEARKLVDDHRHAALELVAQGLEFYAGRFLDRAREKFEAAILEDPTCLEAKAAIKLLEKTNTRVGRTAS
jgi:hypothetical protein